MIAMEFTIDDSEYMYVYPFWGFQITFCLLHTFQLTQKTMIFLKPKLMYLYIHHQVATATFYLLPKIKATRIYILNKYMHV